MEQLNKHREKDKIEESTLTISSELFESLKGADVVRLGKRTNYGAYVVKTAKKKARKLKEKIIP